MLAQLDALKSADAGAVFAQLIRAGLKALIEAEATEAIGAGRYERADGRGTHRNAEGAKTWTGQGTFTHNLIKIAALTLNPDNGAINDHPRSTLRPPFQPPPGQSHFFRSK